MGTGRSRVWIGGRIGRASVPVIAVLKAMARRKKLSKNMSSKGE